MSTVILRLLVVAVISLFASDLWGGHVFVQATHTPLLKISQDQMQGQPQIIQQLYQQVELLAFQLKDKQNQIDANHHQADVNLEQLKIQMEADQQRLKIQMDANQQRLKIQIKANQHQADVNLKRIQDRDENWIQQVSVMCV